MLRRSRCVLIFLLKGIVQYTSGFLPYILLFTQAPILVWFDDTIIDIISIILLTMYYIQWSCWVMIGDCVCVCVFFPSILDIKFVGRTSRGHTGGRSHRTVRGD